ncbi:MAG: DNA topoisomerase IV [Candidatus Marinimicrobia bacterium]|nr:DNA topoisomerase IV [Candidatus Neomarinimicrobiota bacterium]|tara:strand:- start:8856 stop:11381 length:2526 start_codon:yes stop_codon:yes gene_type:complete
MSKNNRNISNMYEDWFLEYASYVILERAVPKIEDGLKPVQRRILHSMREMHDSRYHKVANIIGNTMQFHPHGDAAIRDALVNLGQKDLLIDTQGNWGDIRTGDRAAAPRYIEARLSEFALEVSFNKAITDTQLSYDGRKNEPISLPVKFPLLLAQGAEGIAVGLSTKILPHNFNELLKACIQILKEKSFKIYPDFLTGGLIDVSQYNRGKRGGRIRIRSHIEVIDKNTLKISSIPYSVTTSSLIDSIVKANNSGKIKIKSIEDNTAEKIEIIINLVKGVSPDVTIDALYSFTNCEVSVSPNCCVINDNKPEFISVNELLKISTNNTLNYLKLELQHKLEVLKEKWHLLYLEKIFIENKIYRDIEECDTWDSIINTILSKLKPHLKKLNKEVSKEDIAKLTEIKIKKITKYDKNKQKNTIKNIEHEIDELKNDIKHIVEYTVRYYEHLIKKYGNDKQRKTQISEFDSISVKSVSIANKKLFVNRKEGFIGTKLSKDEFVSKCSNVDDVIVFLDDGRYIVTKVSDKKYLGKNIKYISTWKKNDNHMIYNVVYKDGKSKFSYVKRFSVPTLIRDRFYNITKNSENSKILYFTANPNSESEIINIYLNSKTKAKNKVFEYDFKSISIKNRSSKGNILTKYLVRKITQKSLGESTLGGRKLWIDESIGKINLEDRGLYLGSFNSKDKIIIFYKEGNYEVIEFDLNKRFKMSDIFIIEKFDNSKVYTVLYKDGKSKQYFIKRFKIETLLLDKKFYLIPETRGTKCKLISKFNKLSVRYNYKLKNNDKVSKEINVNDFIEIKGYKSIGKRLDNKSHMSGFTFKEILNEKNEEDSAESENKENNELTLF